MAFADLLGTQRRTIYDPAPAETTAPTQTASPAVPTDYKAQIPGGTTTAPDFWSGIWSGQPTGQWAGWNTGNIFTEGIGDLNPVAAKYGVERDRLATERDAFLNPYEAQYRQTMGTGNVDATTQNVWNDPGFQQFVKTGIAQSQSAPSGASRTNYNFSGMPGFQFDDPYTKQLEDLVRQNLQAIQQPQANPALDQLTQFLNKQFTDLSTSPGYSPEELALIRTQMLEPIERDRSANRQRVEQRTAARGLLPSSGLHEQDLQDLVDRPAEERRVAAQRDLAINAIGQRRSDINQAMNLGKVAGIEIPGLQRAEDQGRRSEALNLSSLLYDLPNRAMQGAQSVISGSPGPQDLFSQSLQLQQAQQQQQYLNAQKWARIGDLIAGLF